MAGPVNELLQVGLQFEKPEYSAAAASLAISGIAAELGISKFKARLGEQSMPPADPEVFETVTGGNTPSSRLEKLGAWGAIAAASFTLANMAKPYEDHSEVKGSIVEVVAAGYPQDSKDVQGAAGQPVSRLSASVEGSLSAASNGKVPFSLILQGSRPEKLDSSDIGNNVDQAKQDIEAVLSQGSFRNGATLNTGVEAAASLSDKPTDIVIVASKANQTDLSKIKNLKDSLTKAHPEDSIQAVLVGQGDGKTTVGNATITAPVEVAGFQSALGAENVHTAKSSAEISQAITSIASGSEQTNDRKSLHGYRSWAILAAGSVALIALRRRYAGGLRAFKDKFKQGSE